MVELVQELIAMNWLQWTDCNKLVARWLRNDDIPAVVETEAGREKIIFIKNESLFTLVYSN